MRTREMILALVLAVGGALAVRLWVVEPRNVISGSMQPTLQIGDRVLVDKLSYRLRSPRAGEIVLFDREVVMVKRLIGLPGQHVEVKDGQVRVDGVALQADYLAEAPEYAWAGL